MILEGREKREEGLDLRIRFSIWEFRDWKGLEEEGIEWEDERNWSEEEIS